MMITKRSIPRRTVLRGVGAVMGLPLLDAMFPALSPLAKAAARPSTRFQAIYPPNGMAMEYWTPTGEGRNFTLSPILEPLAPFREQLIVLSGLRASWNHVHAGASGSFLTGTARGGETETEVLADTSIDQLLAREFGKSTQLASLELSLDKEANAGQCTGGLNCAYTQTISWRSPTMPLPMENNPRAVFERLFGDSGSAAPALRRARMQQKRSLLDSVTESLADLKRNLGVPDQTKLNDYTEAVRDVERRIELAEAQGDVEFELVEQPQGPPASFEEHLKLMLDLQLLALHGDLTRVITFMLGREQSTRTYPQVGVSEAHHPLSHHENDPARIALMSRINTYHVKLVSEYLGKLRSTPDGDGSLLDHMTIMYGSCMSNSTRHAGDNVPILVIGGGSGRLQGGRHLKYPSHTTHTNLLVSLMDKLGLPVERLGNSTGKLDIDTLSGI